MKRLIVLLVLIAAVVIGLVAYEFSKGPRGEIELTCNLEPGKTYKASIRIQEECRRERAGTSFTVNPEFRVDFRFVAGNKQDDGSTELKVTIGSLYQGEPIVPASGRSFYVLMGPDGRIVATKGLPKAAARAAESGPPRTGEVGSAAAQAHWMLTEEAMKGMIEQITAHLPRKPVRRGDTWSHKTTVVDLFAAVLNSKYKLTRRWGGVATIKVNSELEAGPEQAPSIWGVQTVYNVEGTQQLTLKIDESTGWITKGTGTREYSGRLTIRMPGGRTTGVTLSAKSTITFEGD